MPDYFSSTWSQAHSALDAPPITATGAIVARDGPGTSTNVFDHFRTAADGTYRGTLPGGTYTVRANKDGRLFGTPDPANVAVASKGTTTQDFVLPGPGSLRVTVTDESGLPIPAKVQLVGFDGSPDPLSTQTILGLIHNTTGVFGEQREDGLSYGIAFVTFAIEVTERTRRRICLTEAIFSR